MLSGTGTKLPMISEFGLFRYISLISETVDGLERRLSETYSSVHSETVDWETISSSSGWLGETRSAFNAGDIPNEEVRGGYLGGLEAGGLE